MQHVPSTLRTDRTGTVIAANPDGTTGYPALGAVHIPSGTAVLDPAVSIGCKMAAKLAVAELLIGLASYEVQAMDVVSAAEHGETPPTAPRFELRDKAISIDWPEPTVDHAPLKVTVRDGDEGWVFEGLGLSGPQYLDESADKYGEGTILVHDDDVTGTVVIEAVLATSAARDALELSLQRLFAVEPHDFRPGRRVSVKAYYEQAVRMFLARIPFAGSNRPEDVQANEYPLFCFLDVDLANVRLVRHPGLLCTTITVTDMPREE